MYSETCILLGHLGNFYYLCIMKEKLTVDIFINLTELNGYYGKTRKCIGRNRVPLKYRDRIKKLNKLLEDWRNEETYKYS